MKLVWPDLNQICKYYERNKKTEKEKKKRKKNMKLDPGKPFGPALVSVHSPNRLSPKMVPPPLSPPH
jgi:hypothetical protein